MTTTCAVALPSHAGTIHISNPPLDPLAFFSSISLHGLTSKGPSLIHLTRNQSFPAKRFASDLKGIGPEGDNQHWNAISPPVGRLHADLEITEQLSEGRIGMVFAARLVSLRQSVHDETVIALSLPLPSQFCVKLAKPEYIRSLAREAWFYEQLSKEEGYAGVITPVCFGFFTCSLASDVQLDAWSSVRIKPQQPSHTPANKEPVYDFYKDDEYFELVLEDPFYPYFNDERTSHRDSPWHLKQWQSRANRSPIVGVLVTERLGAHLPTEFPAGSEVGNNDLPKEVEAEILALLDDLSAVGILHGDVKFNNILSVAQPWLDSHVCPRHKQVHRWRVIDFDRARKWNQENEIDRRHFSSVQRWVIEDGDPLFWGSLS